MKTVVTFWIVVFALAACGVAAYDVARSGADVAAVLPPAAVLARLAMGV